jgi:hypothetical protein
MNGVISSWLVRFNASGDIGGMVSGKPLTTTIKTETQYQ